MEYQFRKKDDNGDEKLHLSAVICSVCGGKNIQITEHKKITGPPPGTKKHPNRRTTYGYFFKRYICECGNVWEEKAN